MVNLLKLHDGPQRVMQKRNKRLMDYVRYKAMKDRGDKADKKTTEQGEQFIALNVTLKEELPKLFGLTGKLMEACLSNLVQLQTSWLTVVEKRLGSTLERLPERLSQVVTDWSGDFSFSEAQVLSLGICNGSILADATTITGFGSPSASNGVETASSRRPSTVNSNANRTFSMDIGSSPKGSNDFGATTNPSNFVHGTDGLARHGNGSHIFGGRRRTNSSFSSHDPAAPEMSGGQILPSMTSVMTASARPSTDSGVDPANHSEASPSLPQLSLDTPTLQDFLSDPLMAFGDRGGAPDPAEHPASPNGQRSSGIFSSAMPMTESPNSSTPTEETPKKDPSVLFLAASMFEFNIDRSRREAGYPYLTYVAGEVFDVLAEKGDLWLARNQDDPTSQVGWIWTKHFARLAC